MQYNTFEPTPHFNRAINIINNPARLAALDINRLIELKADLYGFHAYPIEEAIEKMTSNFRPRIKQVEERNFQERIGADALKKLNKQARFKMVELADDYSKMQPKIKKKAARQFAFAFADNGRNFKRFPETEALHSSIADYSFEKRHPKKVKTTWEKVADRTITVAKYVVKTAAVAVWAFMGNYFINGDKPEEPNQMAFNHNNIENKISSQVPQRSECDYQLTAQDFSPQKSVKSTVDMSQIISQRQMSSRG